MPEKGKKNRKVDRHRKSAQNTRYKKGKQMTATSEIHFHSSDDRFCGSTEQARRFSFDPHKVTCARCQDRDCFVLSTEAAEYVRSIEA